MGLSFIPEFFPAFFGDWLCTGSGASNGNYYANCDNGPFHLATTHWGYRHYLFFAMGVCLAIVQLAVILNIDFKK